MRKRLQGWRGKPNREDDLGLPCCLTAVPPAALGVAVCFGGGENRAEFSGDGVATSGASAQVLAVSGASSSSSVSSDGSKVDLSRELDEATRRASRCARAASLATRASWRREIFSLSVKRDTFGDFAHAAGWQYA